MHIFQLIEIGALPQTPLHFLAWTKKRSKKIQDYARFAQKISARTAKSSKLARSSLKQGRFLTLFSLIFVAHRTRSVFIKRMYALENKHLFEWRFFMYLASYFPISIPLSPPSPRGKWVCLLYWTLLRRRGIENCLLIKHKYTNIILFHTWSYQNFLSYNMFYGVINGQRWLSAMHWKLKTVDRLSEFRTGTTAPDSSLRKTHFTRFFCPEWKYIPYIIQGNL